MINAEKFTAELAAAGVTVRAFNADGPGEGRAVLTDGTIVPGLAGELGHETGGAPDAAGAAAYRAALLEHNPASTPGQLASRRAAARDVALAAVLVQLQGGAVAPAWCHTVVNNLAARVGEV
jgi:hypothetical protein